MAIRLFRVTEAKKVVRAMATIVEVAEKAGVSVKTVSRVMNNYEHITQKTRDKVERAMTELNYAPSSIARQMRLGDSLSIGMLYGDPSSGYQAQLNYHVLKACAEARRYLVVELFDEKNADWRQQVESFLDRTKVRNLILVPPMCDSSDLHELLKERGINFVLISPSRPVSGVVSVTMDDRKAAKEITQHLIELGHKRLGHISGHPDHIATLYRRQGFEEALKKAGLYDEDDVLIESGRFRFRKTMECAERMLRSKDRPTAIFAANDEMAAAVVMAANKLGLRVPDDVSVVGHDDTPIARTIWPDLTTVAQPFEDIAKAAVKALGTVRRDELRVSETLVLPHSLVVRSSTAPAVV